MTEPNAMQELRSLYDNSLGPYLATQDAQVSATLRNRWLVLVVGLALAGGVLHLGGAQRQRQRIPAGDRVRAGGALDRAIS